MSKNVTTVAPGIRSQDGWLYVNFTFPPGCKQREPLHLRNTPKNVEDAKKILARIKLAIEADEYRRERFFGEEAQTDTTTMAGYFEKWYATLNLAPSTMKLYKSCWNFWLRQRVNGLEFGKVKVRDFTSPDPINTILGNRDVNDKTARNYCGVLSSMLSHAVEHDVLRKTPFGKNRVKLPKKIDYSELINPLEEREVVQLLAHLRRHYGEPTHNFVAFLLETGLRPSEAICVTYEDADFSRNQIRINKAFVEGEYKAPKNDKTRRVDLTERAIALIQSQRKYTAQDGKASGLIFLNPQTNAMYNHNKFSAGIFKRTLRAQKIRERGLYCCRHTFASQLISVARLPIKYVSVQLGHANTAITEMHYAKWVDSANEEILAVRNGLGKRLQKVG
jgi:integrase